MSTAAPVGSLVWARLTGFPWWPAVVDSVAGREVDVVFCGTQDVGSVSIDQIHPFSSKLIWCETKQKERWKKKFRSAVDEAHKRAAGEWTGAADPEVAAAAPPAESGVSESVQAEAAGDEGEAADDAQDAQDAGASAAAPKRVAGHVTTLPADKDLPGWKIVQHSVCGCPASTDAPPHAG